MQYNVDFLIAGWVLTSVVGLHIIVSRHEFKGMLPRLMYIMVLAAWIDCGADIAASIVISSPANFSLITLYAADLVLYVSQSILPALVFIYTVCLCGNLRKENSALLQFCVIPVAALELLILSTPFNGLVFWFDPVTHAYSYGPLIYVVYAVPAFYGVAIAVALFLNFRFLRRVDVWVVAFYCFIAFVTVTWQALYPRTPVVGLSASVCLVLMYTALCNPRGLGDPDTGVFCADEFRRRIAAHINRKKEFDIVFVAFTNRRYLNEVAGAEVIDAVLRGVAGELMNITPSRQVYRLFGSHFAAFSYNRADTDRIVEKANAWIEEEHEFAGRSLRLSGKVSWMHDAASAGKDVDLQAYADYIVDSADAMNIHDSKYLMEGFLDSRNNMRAIENALKNDSFALVFQPIYSPAEDAFVELEALSRLSDESGAISPGDFVPLAEEMGVIVDISKQQFNRLCRIVKASGDTLKQLGIRSIKYNVSAIELTSEDLGELLLAVIKRNNLDPSFFSFEITETAATKRQENLERVVCDLRAAGCKVFLDDFGSGYANLATVMNLPFDGVKIDKSLLDSALADTSRWPFYCELIDIMHSLDKVVIAEGIETDECAQRLIDEEVDLFQGYLFAQPYELEELISFLTSRKNRGTA